MGSAGVALTGTNPFELGAAGVYGEWMVGDSDGAIGRYGETYGRQTSVPCKLSLRPLVDSRLRFKVAVLL